MVIVDTTVWIDYLAGVANPETEWVERELTRQRLGVTDLSLCEVLQGIRNEGEFQQVRAELLTFQVHATGGSEQAVQAAENYRLLRRKGFTIRKTIDCRIATYCLLSGNKLLHRDRDFYPFEKVLGLEVVKA